MASGQPALGVPASSAATQTSDRIIALLPHAPELYHRLVLVVMQVGKTAALQVVASRTGARLINVNLELARLLLDYTQQQRGLQVGRLLAELVEGRGRDPALLDNVEILFDRALQQDPFRLLRGLARNRTIIAAWPGEFAGGILTYATPEHPEHRRYPASDVLVVTTDGSQPPGPAMTGESS